MKENHQTIYLDNAASTRLDPRVLEKMTPYFLDSYAVATSEFAYSMGIEAREALESARTELAGYLHAQPGEFVFTSDPTESTNLAILGLVRGTHGPRRGLVTSRIEDFPVLNTFKYLESEGFPVTYLPVDSNGFVDRERLRQAVNEETLLVSIQHANQEIGTLQPIGEFAAITKTQGAFFHTDASHTFRRVPLDMTALPIDLATVASHTLHGPRGIAGLFLREGTPLKKILQGGFQERNLRPGTENVPGAVGFARAAQLMTEEENEEIRRLRDRLRDELLRRVSHSILNGDRTQRVPQNANISFRYVEGESITLQLDFRGIAVSTGSACFSKSLEASHVMLGIGGDHERAHGSIRFTLSRFTTAEQIETTIAAVAEVVENLRRISPLGKDQGER
jgi:cysteine desulfurase